MFNKNYFVFFTYILNFQFLRYSRYDRKFHKYLKVKCQYFFESYIIYFLYCFFFSYFFFFFHENIIIFVIYIKIFL